MMIVKRWFLQINTHTNDTRVGAAPAHSAGSVPCDDQVHPPLSQQVSLCDLLSAIEWRPRTGMLARFVDFEIFAFNFEAAQVNNHQFMGYVIRMT